MLSSIQDWEFVDSDNDGLVPVIERCRSDYWTSRAQSLIICLIGGVSDSLAIEVLEHVESIIQSRCSANQLLNRLLIAPLKDSRRVGALAKCALGGGFATVGGLLDRIVDLQALLRRLIGMWLNLPAGEFADLPVSREAFWQNLAAQSLLTRLLEAADKPAFRTAWATLAFDEAGVPGRRAIIRLGNLLADTLYPTAVRRGPTIDQAANSERMDDDFRSTPQEGDFASYIAYSRVMKQVNEIVKAISYGKDAKATRFLRQLITEQMRVSSTEQLIKSLCNIAQKCAYMFRADFERQCLNEALSIAPDDAWTLIQMGDHLKRVGQFDEAIEMLERAANSGDATIAMTSMADVWSEAGAYDKATELYERIPAWRDREDVRTGLADIVRHKGDFAAALSEYDRILTEWPDADRAKAGKAEIFRRLGHFDEAIAIYDSMIYDPAIKDFAKLVYRSAKCAVLKHANRLDDAYNLADELVRTAPFHMLARVQRASILALLGQGPKGLLASLPRTSVPRAFGTWITQYCRGLLLLKLERYQEARNLLVDRLSSALLVSDNQTVLRLGAAFALLCCDDIEPAATVLSQIGDVRDYYTEYVYQVLEFHLSVVRQDKERVAEIARRLENVLDRDTVVAKTLIALQEGNFSAAKGYELELLLRIAA